MLLSLSTVMAIASFLAGALPLSFSLSQRQLRFISALGTGVLVGTALIVIIPEGIETLYSVGGNSHAHSHAERSLNLNALPNQRVDIRTISPSMDLPSRLERSIENLLLGTIKVPSTTIPRSPEENALPKPPKGDDDSTEGHVDGNDRTHSAAGTHTLEDAEPTRSLHAWVGISLVLGFVLMYLIDVLPGTLTPSQPKYRPLHISLSNLSRGPHNVMSPTIPSSPPPPEAPPPRSSATTIGLIIHAFADGIALGASTTAPSTSLGFIVFLAIMLHKAPAAFGLTSVLLKQGVGKRTARTHLVLFSLAAPAGALATWAAVHLLGLARLGGDDGLTWATGCVLLFSGGTFLYVAMHSMNDSAATGSSSSSSHSHDHESGSNGYADGSLSAPYARAQKTAPSGSEIATAVVGMLIPLITQLGHVH